MFALPLGNRFDREMVREFLPEFSTHHARIIASGKYPYNDSFRGLMPEIAGPDEDRVIYLLQSLHAIEGEKRRIAGLLEQGFLLLDSLAATTRFESVVIYQPNHYVGGTGCFVTAECSRVVVFDGCMVGVLPKGKRNKGHKINVSSQVYVK